MVTTKAFFRPTRSENHPPTFAPTNMPINAAEVMKPMLESGSFQAMRTAGAAKPKVLRSPSSKKKM